MFVYKGLDWKGVWHALDECVNTLSIVLILIATSAVFGNCLTMLHVPDLAATAITDLTDNPYIIALLIDLILLVLGMIMDMAPIILIATPILLPIATSIGIDPIQFGIIVVLNCGIGLLTPPVGSVLFIGSAVAKRPMEKVVKATLPFYLCMFIALLLLTYIPDISLAIPKLLGGYVSPIANPLALCSSTKRSIRETPCIFKTGACQPFGLRAPVFLRVHQMRTACTAGNTMIQ